MSEFNYGSESTSGAPENNSLALISLIASILGLTLFPFLGSIAGLILGYMAKKQIEESNGTEGGEDLAKWGIILGWVGIGLGILGCCAFFGLFGGTAMLSGMDSFVLPALFAI